MWKRIDSYDYLKFEKSLNVEQVKNDRWFSSLRFLGFSKTKTQNEDLRPIVPRETESNTHAKFLRGNKLRYIDGYVWTNWYLFNIGAMWYKQVSLHDAKERRYKFDKIFTPQASNREVC